MVLATTLLSSCVGGGGGQGAGRMSSVNRKIFEEREARIMMEPLGDYWIGRRWWTQGTRFWGYVRRPRQSWSEAKLVMMYEGYKKTPDRLPEEASAGQTHGFDHNYEYRIYGNFSNGAPIYDPNSDLILPEFILRDYELISTNPGFLFRPDERYLPSALASGVSRAEARRWSGSWEVQRGAPRIETFSSFNMARRILVIEDEPSISENLTLQSEHGRV